MKKIVILTSIVIMVVLTGCSNKPERVTYEGKSNNWSVSINYVREKSKYIGTPVIKYLGTDKVTKAEIDVINKNDNGPFNPSNTVDMMDYFKKDEDVQLVAKEEVSSYKDVRSVTIRWATDGQTFEEGFVLNQINDGE
ncbi:membrane lipoprotein lipid attachment site-containing protein [Paenibacillus xylanilyticus]|uniref:Membrane lipoprotein lipid attachment site-containing protein n=1 Tax=Paenibacillus xylanilyticus TaxID=248903 RepID=A0A7Y6EVH8_9BACL|nr:membrane lipoprotein lipid attachment site-containing protein [Paenibacillus xylanilyticus]NUU75744.1 membrane lipoprotein lipid attachment site-containing protein [Paenibacillus xylanilyticus]